jgi:Zinc carboxypeptidase
VKSIALALILTTLALAQAPASRAETAPASRPETAPSDLAPPPPPPPAIRSPDQVFGFRCGADQKFIGWQQIVDYFREVDDRSIHARVEEIGKSTLGRPFIVAYVSSPENLARLDEIRAYNRRVALGEATKEEIHSGKFPATVLVTAGIHATEFTGTQAMPELLWWLTAGGGPPELRGEFFLQGVCPHPAVEKWLEGCLIVLVPSFNPDGLEIVKAWYEKTLGTPFEGTWPPELYHHFVGHDNNRDAYMLTQVESQHVNRLLYHDVHPQIYVDQHHMGNSDARMFIGEMYEPLNPSVDPLTVMNVQLVGAYMRSRMTAEGKRGLLHRANWNGFWQGGFFTNAWWHHIPAILTETASMRLASPIFQKPSDLDGAYFRGVGKNGNAKEWNHPWPWAGGWWRPRDGVEYDIAAVFAATDAAVTFRAKLAEDRWQAARRGVADGAQAPVAWLVPRAQHDENAPRRLAAKLLSQGATVLEATAPFEANGKAHPAGTLILPAAQPFRSVVRDFVEAQVYPERSGGGDGAPEPPFDWTGWTPAMQMGVAVERVVAWTGKDVAKSGDARRLSAAPAEVASENPAMLASWRAAGRRLTAAAAAETRPESRPVVALPGAANGHARPMRRVGVYQPWTASMDEGWIRWILREYELPSVTLHDADVRAGGLRARCDTILLPSIGAHGIREGHAAGSMPPEYCGGLGAEGAAALAAFVREGGRLVCLDASCDYALDLFPRKELPVEEVTSKLDGKKFSCPGSLLAVELATRAPLNSPMLVGLPQELIVPFQRSRAFTIAAEGAASKNVEAIAHYAERDLCRSGWILGADQIAGKAMALIANVDAGQVVLFGAPVQFRAQSEASFPLLFNALYR